MARGHGEVIEGFQLHRVQIRRGMPPNLPRVAFDVDRVFCISLDERKDRRELFRQTVTRHLSNPVEFYIAQRCDDPVRGCYESHQALAAMALAEGWQRILVFEDDAKPYTLRATQVRWVNRFIRNNDFQALHLGYSMGRTWLTCFRSSPGEKWWRFTPTSSRAKAAGYWRRHLIAERRSMSCSSTRSNNTVCFRCSSVSTQQRKPAATSKQLPLTRTNGGKAIGKNTADRCSRIFGERCSG